MRASHLSCRMILIWEFGGDINLGTTTIVRTRQALSDPAHVGLQLAGRVIRVFGRNTIPSSPEVGVLALQESGDEIIFGPEVSIQARFRHTSLLDHQVNADGVNASPVKKGRCALENPFAHIQ